METAHNFDFDSGQLCLDFANTLGDRPVAQPEEEDLHSYADLVAWGEAAGLLSGNDANDLLREAEHHPSHAAAIFTAAIALREAIYAAFSAVAADAEPAADALAVVNRAIAEAMAHARLAPVEGHFVWEWERDASSLGAVLRPVAWSVAELLTSEELHRVHECAGLDCGWLFVDTSKNGSRRWCDMRTCGNRAKARRHRARVQSAVGKD